VTSGRPRTFDTDHALDAAITVFWRRGYGGASLDELTRAMGMNKSSLYRVYGSKEGLFDHAVARYVHRDLAYARNALGEPTAAEVARNYLCANVDAVTMPGRPPGCMSIQAGLSCGPDDSQVVELLAEHRRAGERALAARFVRAVADGDLPSSANPAALARFLTAIAEGHGVHAATGATAEQLTQSVEIALEVFGGAAHERPPGIPPTPSAGCRGGSRRRTAVHLNG
jgi:AcrR family transcriptional regulator